MQITHVPIRNVSVNRGEHIISLGAVFLLGLAVGSVFVLFQNGKLALPLPAANSQVGAVALAESAAIVETPTADALSTNQVQTTDAKTETLSIPTNSGERERRTMAEVELDINDRTIAIDRVNQEIERTKNASVALVTAFDQNCGNWADVCAKPYTEQLDASNANYNELVGKLRMLSADLASLQSELNSIQN